MTKLKELMKEVIYTDLADEFLVVKLEESVKDHLYWLEDPKFPNETEEDCKETILYIRACIVILGWYTTNTYEDYTIRVNKLAERWEEYY